MSTFGYFTEHIIEAVSISTLGHLYQT